MKENLCGLLVFVMAVAVSHAATQQKHYYGHDAVVDRYGVVAPWYRGLNGQCDFRVRIAAETLKRYPWTTTNNAIAAYPDYLFTSKWQISSNGVITPVNPEDWMNGDLGQRSTSVLNAMVDYYMYSGDPGAIAHMSYMADFLIDHCQTPDDHPWPRFPVSVPTKGKAYGKVDPHGMIQIDICGDMGRALLRAYEVTGNQRWFDAAKHWGDLLAEKCNFSPELPPWPRYANPENVVSWKSNLQTGGVTMVLAFLDELIRLGHLGKDQNIITARAAGVRYVNERLLPRWTVDDIWGRYFWDWENYTQNCSTTADVAAYLIAHPKDFPNWQNDARNILLEFLNRSSANRASGSDIYNGAWAYPESSSCCDRSLWYAPLLDGAIMAQYGVKANDPFLRELGYRQFILQTYDVHENGVSEDNIDGGILVNGTWLNIAHPLPLRWVLAGIGWLPEELGASRENHLVRSSAVVNSIVYGNGLIQYRTFDAPAETRDTLRLSFVPKTVLADGKKLSKQRNLENNGFTVKKLANGDAIVEIRHDGAKQISIVGNDPQRVINAKELNYVGAWKKDNTSDGSIFFTQNRDASVTAKFRGNQVRLVGRADPSGGQAEVFIDGVKQLVPIDFWNPSERVQQILYYKNGLESGDHELKIVALGQHNPYSRGDRVYIDGVQFSSENKASHFPSGTGPTGPQRMIFGYDQRTDYKDTKGASWRPGTEVITRVGSRLDTIAAGWWTNAVGPITGTADPALYQYGYHARDFWVNLTVGPGKYDVRLAFANTRGIDTAVNSFDISINGRRVVRNLDVTATAGGTNKAVDLFFKDIPAENGAIEIRFTGSLFSEAEGTKRGEAFVQAIEIDRKLTGKGAVPVSSTHEPASNLVLNAGFEETVGRVAVTAKKPANQNEWSMTAVGKTQSFAGQESECQPGLVHSGKGALRVFIEGGGRTLANQEVEVKPDTEYTASVWVHAVDLTGKGFGHNTNDSAGLTLQEMNKFNKVQFNAVKVAIKQAGPYVFVTKTFTTGPNTTRLRFSLETVMQCSPADGYVSYDDCVLKEASLLKTSRK